MWWGWWSRGHNRIVGRTVKEQILGWAAKRSTYLVYLMKIDTQPKYTPIFPNRRGWMEARIVAIYLCCELHIYVWLFSTRIVYVMLVYGLLRGEFDLIWFRHRVGCVRFVLNCWAFCVGVGCPFCEQMWVFCWICMCVWSIRYAYNMMNECIDTFRRHFCGRFMFDFGQLYLSIASFSHVIRRVEMTVDLKKGIAPDSMSVSVW